MRIIGIANSEPITSYLVPSDYSDDKYDGQAILKDRYGNPVVVCISKSDEPIRYRVLHNNNILFFTHYKDVSKYCNKFRCELIKRR